MLWLGMLRLRHENKMNIKVIRLMESYFKGSTMTKKKNNRFMMCYLGNCATVEKFNGIVYLIT